MRNEKETVKGCKIIEDLYTLNTDKTGKSLQEVAWKSIWSFTDISTKYVILLRVKMPHIKAISLDMTLKGFDTHLVFQLKQADRKHHK